MNGILLTAAVKYHLTFFFIHSGFVSSSIAATTQGTIVQTPVDVTNTTTTISSKTASTENVNANNGSDVKISTLPDKQTSRSNGIVANTAETNTTIAGIFVASYVGLTLSQTQWKKEKSPVTKNFSFFSQCCLSVWRTFCHFHQNLSCRRQTFSFWKSLKFVVLERFNPLLQNPKVLKTLTDKSFEKIVGKGENAFNQHFLLSPQYFLPFQRILVNFRYLRI